MTFWDYLFKTWLWSLVGALVFGAIIYLLVAAEHAKKKK